MVVVWSVQNLGCRGGGGGGGGCLFWRKPVPGLAGGACLFWRNVPGLAGRAGAALVAVPVLPFHQGYPTLVVGHCPVCSWLLLSAVVAEVRGPFACWRTDPLGSCS